MSKFVKIKYRQPQDVPNATHEIVLNVDEIKNIMNLGDGKWGLLIRNAKTYLMIRDATAQNIISKLRQFRMLLAEDEE